MRLCDHTRPSLMRFFARQNVNDFILRVKSNSGRFDRMAQDDAFLRPATSRFPADHDLRRSICEFSDAGNNQIPKVGQDCEWRPVRCPAQAARPLFSVRGLSGARSLRALRSSCQHPAVVQTGVQPRPLRAAADLRPTTRDHSDEAAQQTHASAGSRRVRIRRAHRAVSRTCRAVARVPDASGESMSRTLKASMSSMSMAVPVSVP